MAGAAHVSAVCGSGQVSFPAPARASPGSSSLPRWDGACVCVRGGRGEAEGLEPGDVVEGVEEAGNRKGGSGPKSVTQQNGVGYHESSGWGEVGTADPSTNLFPTLRFFLTREGNSSVSQEVACLDHPRGMASRHGVLLGLAMRACRAVRENLSRLTSQNSVS